jgi:hypothetical protein
LVLRPEASPVICRAEPLPSELSELPRAYWLLLAELALELTGWVDSAY